MLLHVIILPVGLYVQDKSALLSVDPQDLNSSLFFDSNTTRSGNASRGDIGNVLTPFLSSLTACINRCNLSKLLGRRQEHCPFVSQNLLVEEDR